LEKHPIQLEHISISKIDFVGYRSALQGDVAGESSVNVNFKYSPYNIDQKAIMLMGEATIGSKLESPSLETVKENPFYLYVRIHGFFTADESQVDAGYADSFASKNAPTLMYPYLREHVHSVAIRCGYPNVVLPLVKIPHQNQLDKNRPENK